MFSQLLLRKLPLLTLIWRPRRVYPPLREHNSNLSRRRPCYLHCRTPSLGDWVGGKIKVIEDYGETEVMLAQYKRACTLANMRWWIQNGDGQNRSFSFSYDSRETTESERVQALRSADTTET